MSAIDPVPCLVCGKELDNVMADVPNLPSGAIVFQANGNYGSRVFDSVDGSYLEINICDSCILDRKDRVLRGRTQVVTRGELLEYWDGKIGS